MTRERTDGGWGSGLTDLQGNVTLPLLNGVVYQVDVTPGSGSPFLPAKSTVIPMGRTIVVLGCEVPDDAFIINLYYDVLGRTSAPSPGELAYWAGRLQAGTPRWAVAQTFVDSYEARSLIIQEDYELTLLRAADAAGLAYWEAQLAAGVPSSVPMILSGSRPRAAPRSPRDRRPGQDAPALADGATSEDHQARRSAARLYAGVDSPTLV